MNDFSDIIEDFEEATFDLEMSFFTLSNTKDIKQIIDNLSNIT